MLGKPGSPYQRAMYPLALCMMIYFLKQILIRYRWLENHAAFMLSLSLITILTECSIFLSPLQYNITPM